MKPILHPLMMLLAWPFLANGFGFLLFASSGHGMAGFIHTGFFLGVVGGVGSVALWLLRGWRRLPELNLASAGLLGSVAGLVTFPLSTFIAEDTIYFPNDAFQATLLLYLCILGAAVGMLVTFAYHRYAR